jgi:predicted nucleic acid-binding protein
MRKFKIYLDTSVISYLDQHEQAEKRAETHRLWDKIKAGEFDVVISDVTEAEINDCDDEKRKTLTDYLKQIRYTVSVFGDDKGVEIVNKIIENGILRRANIDDCRHLAMAIISGCDAIVSWNFKHIVNYKTIDGVRTITMSEGYPNILIFSPASLIEGD